MTISYNIKMSFSPIYIYITKKPEPIRKVKNIKHTKAETKKSDEERKKNDPRD
jgi:hypothetical protein